MGKRKYEFIALLLCMLPVSVQASTADDLYKVYNKGYVTEVPETVVQTISKYDSAKRYASMYTYVINSEYDDTELLSKEAAMEEELKQLEIELLDGYSKPLAELYELEDRYYSIKEDLANLKSSRVSYVVDTESVKADEIPTYSEYKEAIRIRDDCLAKNNIGSLDNLSVPLQAQAYLVDSNEDKSVYKTIDGTGVLSIFNGVVDKIYETREDGICCVIDNYNGIKTYLCSLETVDVSEGDTVYQNQRIGYLKGTTAIFKLSLYGKFVDISKIFTEEFSQ